ncbi:MAG: hypothetical protein CMF52_09150 [Legionellales bacterium]|nr:hypothetical protein [Legionellales bacterium]HAV93404.1 hypothetical protein [Pseudomonadota bacterium]|tara:strand:- start:763 stop:1371 length:609 start_codon:yes stop_codon:yes gene_type:complete
MITWSLWLDIMLLVFFANAMILVNHPVKSVLSLMGCFLGTSILWLMLGADFLAFVLIFVYVGAVMTMFLFMVMMLNISEYAIEDRLSFLRRCAVLLLTLVVPVIVYYMTQFSADKPFGYVDIMRNDWGLTTDHLVDFAQVLYQEYGVLLQLLAFILMIPMIVATGIVRQGPPSGVKSQVRSQQLAVSARDRLTLVNSKSRKS